MSSQERQSIIAALEGAGKNENGRPHPMSVSQIMAVIGRTDRNAVDRLLGKMRKGGQVERAGRGLYTLSDHSGQIDASVSAPDQSDPGPNLTAPDAAGNLTGAEGGQIADRPSPGQEAAPWALSAADLARRAERYQIARREKGEAIANRTLRWELQDAGVPYQRLQGEVDRVQQLAASGTVLY